MKAAKKISGRIFRNKKAAMLLYMATIALVIASFTFLTIKVSEKPEKWEPKYIGEHQLALLKTAVNAQKLLLYIDQAAKPTAAQAIYNFAQKGGYSSGSECGQYFGYEKWRTSEKENEEMKIKNCFPDEKSIRYELANALNNELYKYLNVYWGKSQVMLAGAAVSATQAAAGTENIGIKVGDSTINIRKTPYAGPYQFKMLIIHDDENVAPRATHEVMKENNFGGIIYELDSGGTREISFKYGEKTCKIDPNRMFTPEGRKGMISDNCKDDQGAQDALVPLAKAILNLFSDTPYLIVLHNNDAGGFGINSYKSSYGPATQEVYIGKDDPDDFVYVTKKATFDYFKSKGYNVVLQKPGLKNGPFSEYSNDGSLSVEVDTGKDYINIEAEGKQSGHLDFQKKILLDALKHIAPQLEGEKKEVVVAQANQITTNALSDITAAPIYIRPTMAQSFADLPIGALGKMPPNNYETILEQKDRLKITAVAKENAEFDIILGEIKTRKKAAAEAVEKAVTYIIGGGVAAGECHYCNAVREEISKWSQDDYQKCMAQGGMCCKAACPPGSRIVPNVPYYHQCDSALRTSTTGCQPGGRSSCTSGCGPTSFKMGLEAFGIRMDIKELFCPGENSVYEPGGGQPSWMERVAKKLGLAGSEHIEGGIRTDEQFSDLVRNIVSGKPTPISITEQGRQLNMERGYKTAGHYVLGIGGNDDYLIINDPFPGKACPRSVGEHLVLTKQHVKTATAGKRIVYIGKAS